MVARDTNRVGAYTVYGSIDHDGRRYPVTSNPHGSSSSYVMRVWKSRPGVDLIASIRDPADPRADWHPEFDGKPAAEKSDLVASAVKIYQTWKAKQ